ncbi:MAG: hypothetical protein ACE5KE_11715, partial [Methanosarcinales archaeon]
PLALFQNFLNLELALIQEYLKISLFQKPLILNLQLSKKAIKMALFQKPLIWKAVWVSKRSLKRHVI